MMSLSPEILWAVAGLILLIIEIFTLTFVVAFFGVAALVVAALRATGLLDNLSVELFLFAIMGFSCIFLFRKRMQNIFRKSRGHSIDEHATLELTSDIPPGATARVEYQGTSWEAMNQSQVALKKGERAVIIRTEGVRLIVTPHR